ncbi:hypothetical protein BCR35DRAFT_333554 [Leucosporidium creatinivorum]|uniref:Zn(2)-C6 fungal-type domain-containing protein n=1 Tax=Leucosporidium creatinivorum TaxID=106004 RepID=A0A1Y2EQH2_9BASI|nr:hypothetical protein BCR35DRAFT_333554 [Leucosporidium creatinivorum]
MPRLTPKLGQSRPLRDDTRYLSARKTRCSRTESCSECELRREKCVWGGKSKPSRTKEEANLASSEREVARLARIVGRLEAHIQMLSKELIKGRRARRELESKVNPGAEEKAASPPSADAPSSPSPHEGASASTSPSCTEVSFSTIQESHPPPPCHPELSSFYLPTPASALAELAPIAFPIHPTFPSTTASYTSSTFYIPYQPATGCTRHGSFAAPSHPAPVPAAFADFAYSFPPSPQSSYPFSQARPSLVVNTRVYPPAEVGVQQQMDGSWWNLGVGDGGDWAQGF